MSTPINLQISDKLRHFGLTDNLGTFAPSAPTFTDTVTITDALVILEAGFITIPLEGVSFSDAISVVLGLGVCQRELTYSSGAEAVDCSTIVGDPPDLAPISDNLDAVIVGINQALSETIVISDSLVVPSNITLGLSDSISLSDDGGSDVLGLLELPTDSLSLSDELDTFAPYNIEIDEGLNLSDNISLSGNGIPITFSMGDGYTLVDSDIVIAGCQEILTDSLTTYTDIVKALEAGLINIGEAISLVDTLHIDSPIQGIPVSDSLLFTDDTDVGYNLLFAGILSQIVLSDSILLSLVTVDPQVSDAYTLSDAVVITLSTASLTFADSYSLSDSIAIALAFNRLVSVSDTLALADNAEVLTFTDFIDYVRRYLNDVPANSNVGS